MNDHPPASLQCVNMLVAYPDTDARQCYFDRGVGLGEPCDPEVVPFRQKQSSCFRE